MSEQDPFSLLGFPARPALDTDTVRERFRQLSDTLHPDRAGGDATRFAALNAACSALTDPVARLRALALLSGAGTANAKRPVPPGFADLFLQAGDLSRRLDDFTRRKTAASSALGRALLADEEMEITESAREFLDQLAAKRSELDAALSHADARWETDRTELAPQLPELADAFAYLARWVGEIQERLLCLTLIPDSAP